MAKVQRADIDSPLAEMAGFIARLNFDNLPPSLVARAKVHILDTLGAALAGSCSREFALVGSTVRDQEQGGASVWGTDRRLSPRDAALVNGVAAHVFELDDTGGCDHSGAVVLPAVLAALPDADGPVHGRELITAVIAGYEVGRRVLEASGGYGPHNGAGWHSTGTCGTMAAAAAVARLWNLPAPAMAEAIALATSFSSGLWAFIHDGSQAKKIHAGRAAEGGLLAATLVRAGLSGPLRVFDDVWGGFFRTFDRAEGDTTRLTDGLGRIWKLERVSLKPYASCRGTHSAIDALEDLLAETGQDADAIARIEVRLSAMLMGMCGGTDSGPLAAAQMSLPYALAARCVFGEADLAAYSTLHRHEPAIAAMMTRIVLSVDALMAPMDEPVVRLLFKDGTMAERMVPRATGSPERPMTPDAIRRKFEVLAGMALPSTAVAALSSCIEHLDSLADCLHLDALIGARRTDHSLFQ
jgi:2-methylcitrate dehydratase PrpD